MQNPYLTRYVILVFIAFLFIMDSTVLFRCYTIPQSFTKNLQKLFSVFPPLTNKDYSCLLSFIRNKLICIGIVKEFHISHGVCFSVEYNVIFRVLQDTGTNAVLTYNAQSIGTHKFRHGIVHACFFGGVFEHTITLYGCPFRKDYSGKLICGIDNITVKFAVLKNDRSKISADCYILIN